MSKMMLNIFKDRQGKSILDMSKEEQISEDTFYVNYDDLKDKRILLTVMSFDYDICIFEVGEGIQDSRIVDIVKNTSNQVKIIKGEGVDDNVYEVLKVLYAEKAGIIRKCMMTGKDVFSALEII